MKLAICIGHSRHGDNGAASVTGVSEYTYNLNVGTLMRDILRKRGVECEVIAKYAGNNYGQAMRLLAAHLKDKGYTHAIELHFNAASPSAHGHEFLYWHSSKGGRSLAGQFASSFQDAFPESRPRNNGGLKPIAPGDRGGLFLSLTHCPSLILEPFFGSNQEEWQYFSTNTAWIVRGGGENHHRMREMKLAICIGHSRHGDNGAASVTGVSEYTYNLNVGTLMRDILRKRGVECEVIAKYAGNNYGQAMRLLAAHLKDKGYTHAIELHFNAASPSAHGHEFLYWHSSKGGRSLAGQFASSFQDAFPESRPRNNGGLKPIAPGDRGGLFLSLTHCPSLILEPFFGSNQEEWQYFSTNQDKLAMAYADAVS